MKKFIGIMAVLLIITAAAAAALSAFRHSSREMSGESFVTATDDPNVNWYTSPRLGLRFKYALIDPSAPAEQRNQVVENGNKISTTTGGSVEILPKNPSLSLRETVQAQFPACKVLAINPSSPHLNEAVRVYLPDLAGQPLWDFAGDPVLTEKDKACLEKISESPLYFAGSTTFPDRYIRVVSSTQSVEAVLSMQGDRIIPWMSTVEFIPR